MDRASKHRGKKDVKGRKSPKVPIKTYRWEDIRRARKKGGYPWTYLYKPPFSEDIDPEPYTMEALRRSKSSSTMEARSDGVDISEVTTLESGKTTPSMFRMDHIQVVTEPDDASAKNSRAGSEVIEEYAEEEEKDLEDDVQIKEFHTESAESSDNISQYLDKDDGDPSNSNPQEDPSARGKGSDDPESPTRKRKLSAESSYSRYSLSKLGLVKKLKEAKNKIRVPKISFPTKKLGRNKRSSPPRDTKKETKDCKKECKDSKNEAKESKKDQKESKNMPKESKKEQKVSKKDAKKKTEESKSKDRKPVYIHIPLKPPSGETDEFSYLEFEPKREEATSESEGNKEGNKENAEANGGDKLTPKRSLKINPAFKQLLKDVRQLKQKDEVEVKAENEKNYENEGVLEKNDKDQSDQGTLLAKVETENKQDKDQGDLKVKDVEARDDKALKKVEKMDEPSKIDEKQDSAVMQITQDNKEELDLEEQTPDDNGLQEDVFDKLFERKNSKKEGLPSPSSSREVRSKSAEPQRKRRSSIESSYSRKSLSKLGILKKLKEAKDKIKSSFSLSSLFRKESKKNPEKKTDDKEPKDKKPKLSAIVKEKKAEPPKKIQPKYIHIPLKPPEGQTDEFSHLEFDAKAVNETARAASPQKEDSIESSSPPNNDIQFIFLTPPSDDEVLEEKVSGVPDTPSSDSDVVFFSSLKKLAQHVVDEISPETKEGLETVKEESVSDRSSVGELENKEEDIVKEVKEQKQDEQKFPEKTEEIIVQKSVDENKESPEEEDESTPKNGETNKEPDKDQKLDATSSEKMLIDEEDGLNEPSTKHEQSTELKSSLKTEPASPTMKKKVSFKRKKIAKEATDKNGPQEAKTKNDTDNGYEEIVPPKEDESATVIEGNKSVEDKDVKSLEGVVDKDGDSKEAVMLSQSMSVDEEKSYLDQKIVKDTSLEEDYNKWSKPSDHEYEPVNPPDDVIVMTSYTPIVTLVDTQADSGPKVIISASEILEKPQEEKRKSIFRFGGFKKDVVEDTSKNIGEPAVDQSVSELTEDPDAKKKSEEPSKFQKAFRQKTDQFKNKTNELRNKVRNMKKPNIHLPNRPKFQKPDFKKFKIEKPKLNFPKIPDTTTIHLPSFSLPRKTKTIEKRTVTTKQHSTESNFGDTTKKQPLFDFSTFPRLLKKKPKDERQVDLATMPRTKKEKEKKSKDSESGGESVRVPLHSEDSTDTREDSVERERSSHMRFDKEIDIDDDYERENHEINEAEYLSRWQRGNFNSRDQTRRNQEETFEDRDALEDRYERDTSADRYEQEEMVGERYQGRGTSEDGQREELEDRSELDEEEEEFLRRLRQNKEIITDLDNLDDLNDDGGQQIRDGYSSEGSVSLHQRGRLGKLDIDSDEFFVVHEIREGFQTPANALAQMNEYDPIGSNRSLPQEAKRKPIKKPKRKKTPHVSQEELHGDEESMDGIPTPSRPKRRSKKNKKKSNFDEDKVIPYQETIPSEHNIPYGTRLEFPRESLGILGDDEREDQDFEFMYENEKMAGKEQPEIAITDPYTQFQFMERQMREREESNVRERGRDVVHPSAPPRKHKSLKSLNMSENESILMGDQKYPYEDQKYDPSNIEEYIIPAQEAQVPPRRPSRRSRSQNSSLSRISLPPSPRDEESLLAESYTSENVHMTSSGVEKDEVPNYLRENEREEDIPPYLENDGPIKPCVEEPCIQDLRDCMGYAIVDKQKWMREPPLPPPRTPPRRRKRQISSEQKFATVPRNMGQQNGDQAPTRPLRNYSTLTQIKSQRKKDILYENDKENIDYIEMEDELNRDLQSGDVIQKMRQRPLPAPPRPPRKPKSFRRSLQDITSKENIINESREVHDHEKSSIIEENVSTQTEALPDDFVCEEIRQEPTDTVISPSYGPNIRRELITPTVYSYEETVTHGSLLVEPLNGAKILPDRQLSRERLVPVSREESDEETSEIPESFKKLRSPEVTAHHIRNPPVEIIRTEKLQVTDLDVDRLRVNQLLASKIVVSEIDSGSIQADEIQGKSGSLRIGEIELPPRLLDEIVQKLRSEGLRAEESFQTHDQTSQEAQKKTSICEYPLEAAQTIPYQETPPVDTLDPYTHQVSNIPIVDSNQDQQLNELDPEPPLPPPRSFAPNEFHPDAPLRPSRKSRESLGHQEPQEDSTVNSEDSNPHPAELESSRSAPTDIRLEMEQPDVDDEPPPRPPQPVEGMYVPSQPPASFYALRAHKYVEGLDNENIPMAPRRKRHHQRSRSRPVSRSKSTSDSSSVRASMQSPRAQRRLSEPNTIPELTGRLIRACGSTVNCSIKRLIYHLTENVLGNADGKQDIHVFMIILLVLIAGLILLGYGEDRTVIHLHHWEYFNPPKDL